MRAEWGFRRLPSLCKAIASLSDLLFPFLSPSSSGLSPPLSHQDPRRHPPPAERSSPPGPVRPGPGSSSPGAAPAAGGCLEQEAATARPAGPLVCRRRGFTARIPRRPGAAAPASATPGRSFSCFLPFFPPIFFSSLNSSPLALGRIPTSFSAVIALQAPLGSRPVPGEPPVPPRRCQAGSGRDERPGSGA